MKRCLIAALLCVVCATDLAAQSPRKMHFYVSAGGAFPTGDFNVRFNFGFTGSVGLGFRLAKGLDLGTKIEYQTFVIDPTAFTDSIAGGDFNTLMVGVDLHYIVPLVGYGFKPILQIGTGLAYSSISQLTYGDFTFPAEHETRLYSSLGAGIEIGVSPRIKAFFLARYVRIHSSGPKAEFYPMITGIRF